MGFFSLFNIADMSSSVLTILLVVLLVWLGVLTITLIIFFKHCRRGKKSKSRRGSIDDEGDTHSHI